jgi:hypothetical protein
VPPNGPTVTLPAFDRGELEELRRCVDGRHEILDALRDQAEHPAVRCFIDGQLTVLFRLSAVVAECLAALEGRR